MRKFVHNANALCVLILVALLQCFVASAAAAETGRSGQTVFATAEEALQELKSAAKAEDVSRMTKLFGRQSEEIFSTGDPVGDAYTLRRLSLRFDQRCELFPVTSDDFKQEQWYLVRYAIEGWNLRVPLVNRGKGWSFATEYATDATLKVRRSLNEVATVDTLRALVQAQREYKSRDRNGDGVAEYAKAIISSAGKHDGLYWPADGSASPSPIDGLVARAIESGYQSRDKSAPTYYGYTYRILTAQGGKTRGGKQSYLKDGRLVNGFAILAHPVEWNSSGDFTFLVGSDAQVWKRDFGTRTKSLTSAITSMDLDQNWLRVDPMLGGKNSRQNW
jgi:hypothetical protein